MLAPALAWLLLTALARAAEPSAPDAVTATVPAAPPDERPLFAWADRCPSTAMAAALYTGRATEVTSAQHAGKAVLRVRFQASAGSPRGTHRETTWMLLEGCRAVAIVREDTGPDAVTGFVVAKATEAPSADEQATLMGWLGYARWDPRRPEHVLTTARFEPRPAPSDVVLADGRAATLHRTPGRAWQDGPAPTPARVWRPATEAPAGAVCPCAALYDVPALVRAGPSGPYTARVYSTLSDGFTVLEDPARDRWAVEPRAPGPGGEPPAGAVPASAAHLRVAWWHARPATEGQPPVDDTTTLTAYDPATGASFVLVVPGGEAFAWSASGLRVGKAEIPTATLLGWLGG